MIAQTKRFKKNTPIFVCIALITFAWSSAFASPIFEAPDPEDPTLKDRPVSQDSSLPPDDTYYQLRPALQYVVRGGVSAVGDNQGSQLSGAVGVMVFVEAGRLNLVIRGQAAGWPGVGFDSAEGSLRMRLRWPLDKTHTIWWGAGADIDGRYAHDPRIDSFFRTQAVVMLGVMHHFNRECIAYVYAKTGLGLVDIDGVGDRFLDRYSRPMVGTEGFLQCDRVRVFVDATHAFKLGSSGATDKVDFEVSKTWPVKDLLEIGVFGKADYTIDRVGSAQQALPDLSPGVDRRIHRYQGGLEIRY